MAYGERLTQYAEYIAKDVGTTPDGAAQTIYDAFSTKDEAKKKQLVDFLAYRYKIPTDEISRQLQDAYDAEAPVLAKEPTPSIPREEFNQFVPQPQTIPDSGIGNIPVSRNENEDPNVARTIAKAKEVTTPNVLPDISQQKLFKPEVKKEDVVKVETVKSTEAEPTKFQSPTVVADLSRQAREKLKESATLQEDEKGIITSGLKMGTASGVSGLLKSVPATWNLIATISDGVNAGLNAALEKVTGERSAFLDTPAPKASAEYLKNIQTGIKGIDTDYFDSIASANNIIQNKFDGKGVIGLIQEDRKGDAAVALASQVVGTIPQLAALALTRGLGIEGLASTAPLGFMAQGQRAGELAQDDPNNVKTTEQQKALSSAASGVYSTVFELMGTSKIFDRIMRTIKGTAVKEGKEVARGIFVPVLKDAFKIALMQDAKQEFSEEALTSIAQDITDNAIGVEKLSWSDIGRRAAENGLVGGVTGLGMGGFRVGVKQISNTPEIAPDKPVETKTIEAPTARTLEELGHTPESLNTIASKNYQEALDVLAQIAPENVSQETERFINAKTASTAAEDKLTTLSKVGMTPAEYAEKYAAKQELPIDPKDLTNADKKLVYEAIQARNTATKETDKAVKAQDKEKARIAKEINDNLAKAGLIEKPAVEKKSALTIQGMSVSEFVDKNTDPKTGLNIDALTDEKEIQAVRKEAERRANKAKVDKQKAEIKAKAEAIKKEAGLKTKDREMDELTAPLSVPTPTAEIDVANKPKEATTQTVTTPEVLTTQPIQPDATPASAVESRQGVKPVAKKVSKKKKQADVPSVQTVTETTVTSPPANIPEAAPIVEQAKAENPLKLYRGTRKDGESRFGGEYFTADEAVAQKYAGKTGQVEELDISKEAKVLDLSDPDTLFNYMVEKGIVEQGDVDAENYIKSGQLYQYDGSGNTENKLIGAAGAEGYQILKFPDNLQSETDNNAYVVIDRTAKESPIATAKPEAPPIEIVAADEETEAITMAIPSQVKEARAAKEKAITEATAKANESGYLPEQTSKKVSLFNADPKEVASLNKIARTLIILSEYANTFGSVVPLARLRGAVRAYNNIGFKDKVKDDAATYAYRTINKYLAIAREPQHNKRLVDAEEEADIVRSFGKPLNQEDFNKTAKNYELTEDGDTVDTTEVNYVVGDIIKRYFGGKVPTKIEIKVGGVDSKGQPLNQRAAQISISKDGATIYVNRNLARASTRATIIHEILGHLGLGGVLKTEPGTYKALRSIYEQEKAAHKQAKKFMDTESKEYLDRFGVLDDHADATDDVRFAEWVANIAETYDRSGALGNRGKAWGAVKDFFRRLYQRIFGQMPTAKIEKIVGDAIGRMQEGDVAVDETVADKGVEPKAVDDATSFLKDAKYTPEDTPAMAAAKTSDAAMKDLANVLLNKNPEAVEIYGKDLSVAIANLEGKTFLDKIKKKVYDFTDLLAHSNGIIKRLQEKLNKEYEGSPTPQKIKSWESLKLLSGMTAHKQKAFVNNFIAPLAKIMIDNNITAEELGTWRMMHHIPEVRAFFESKGKAVDGDGVLYGVTNEQALATIAEMSKDPKRTQALKLASNVLEQINNYKLNIAVESGIFSNELVAYLNKIYPTHIPLRGIDTSVMDVMNEDPDAPKMTPEEADALNELVATTPQVVGKSTGETGYLARRRGTDYKAESELSLLSLISNAQAMISRVAMNDNKNNFVDMVMTSPGSVDFWEVITKKQYDSIKDGDIKDYKWGMSPVKRKNAVVKGMRNGKPFFIEINDERIYHAVLQSNGAWIKQVARFLPVINKATRALSSVYTSKNPQFLTTNPLRDTQQAMSLSYVDNGFRGLGNFMLTYASTAKPIVQAMGRYERGEKPRNKIEQYYFEAVEDGAFIKRSEYAGVESTKEGLKDLGVAVTYEEKKSALRKVGSATVRGFNLVTSPITYLNEMMETLTRASYYVSQREQGKSRRVASVAARDVSVDFEQSGKIGALLNVPLAFVNAGMVGSGLVIRTTIGSRRGRQLALGMITLGIFQAAMNDWRAPDDEEGVNAWQKLPKYKKATKWNWWVGGDETEGDFVSLPMSYGFNIFPALGAGLYDAARGHTTFAQVGKDFIANIMNAYSPVEGDPIRAVTPTIVKPFMEVALNEDYAGRPIHPTAMFGQEISDRWRQLGRNTPLIYKDVLGTVIPSLPEPFDVFYPDDIGYLLKAYSGGYGDFAARSGRALSARERGEEIELANMPVFSKFIAKATDKSFYDGVYRETKPILDTYKKDKKNTTKYKEMITAKAGYTPSTVEGDKVAELDVYAGRVESAKDMFYKMLDQTSYAKDKKDKQETFKRADTIFKDITLPALKAYYHFYNANKSIIKKQSRDYGDQESKLASQARRM